LYFGDRGGIGVEYDDAASQIVLWVLIGKDFYASLKARQRGRDLRPGSMLRFG